jgi:hypothetical protein
MMDWGYGFAATCLGIYTANISGDISFTISRITSDESQIKAHHTNDTDSSLSKVVREFIGNPRFLRGSKIKIRKLMLDNLRQEVELSNLDHTCLSSLSLQNYFTSESEISILRIQQMFSGLSLQVLDRMFRI